MGGTGEWKNRNSTVVHGDIDKNANSLYLKKLLECEGANLF